MTTLQSRLSKYFIGVVGAMVVSSFLWGQEQTTIQIMNANVMEFKKHNGDRQKKLRGDVELKHKSARLFCDSALVYDGGNQVDAHGNVHIKESDTVNIYGQKLHYNSISRVAVLKEKVRMEKPSMKLTTDQLTYNIKEDLAFYTTGGKLVDNKNTLTSKTGYYHMNSDDAYFRHNVKLDHPKYRVRCDTLRYNTKTEIVYFLGPSTIYSDENTIRCRYGWYDTKAEKARFSRSAQIESGAYIIQGDTLYYDRQAGRGRAINNVQWQDTSATTFITGHYGKYYKEGKRAMVTRQPLLTNIEDGDSLYLTADTLKTYLKTDTIGDTLKQYRLFKAYHQVSILKQSFQAVCDSLKYSFADSTFWLYQSPMLWTNNTQMSGDTISVKTEQNSIQQLDIYRNGFIVNRVDSQLYNQVKGVNMTGYFTNDTLRRLFVSNRAKSLYYAKDDSNRFLGLNEARSENMVLRFKNNEVQEVTFLSQPRATLHPMREVDPKAMRLEGFGWYRERRPRSRYHLLKDRVPPQ